MNKLFSQLLMPRVGFAVAALACFGIVGFAFYLQYVKEMEPCPLCWFQRLALVGVGLAFLVGALRGGKGSAPAWAALLVTFAALIGAGIAARHIWIQNLPADQVPACGQGIEFMLENMPFLDVFQKALKGSGECAKRDTWVGLTLPTWTMILFVGSILWAWLIAFRAKRAAGSLRF